MISKIKLSIENLHLRLAILINHIKKHRIDDDVAVHVYLEPLSPPTPQHLGLPLDIHGGLQLHLSARHVSRELGGAPRELLPLEASRQAQDPAGVGALRAGVHPRRAEQRALVEDGHGGGAVLDGDDVGVADVHGEDEIGVERRGEVDPEGGELDGGQVEGGVPGTANHHRRDSGCRGRPDQGGAPAPMPLFAHRRRREMTTAVGLGFGGLGKERCFGLGGKCEMAEMGLLDAACLWVEGIIGNLLDLFEQREAVDSC